MLDPRLSMSYFDALVYTEVEIFATAIKTSLELHRLSNVKQMPVSINVINWASSLHVKTL